MRTKLFSGILLVFAFAAAAMQEAEAQQRVQKTYYYACYYSDSDIEQAWVTPVKSVTVYENDRDNGRYVATYLESQWGEYLEAELRNPGDLGFAGVIVYADEAKTVSAIRQHAADYRSSGYRVATMPHFSYVRTANDKRAD